MQLRFPALPQSRGIPAGPGGQSLPPAQGKEQLLSPPALDCLLYRPLTELPYPVGRGQRSPQPLGQAGASIMGKGGVPQITPADKWVSNGVLSLAPPISKGMGECHAGRTLAPLGLQLCPQPERWQGRGASPLLEGVIPALPVPADLRLPEVHAGRAIHEE